MKVKNQKKAMKAKNQVKRDPTRKELRKQQRINAKAKKNDWYTKKKNKAQEPKLSGQDSEESFVEEKPQIKQKQKQPKRQAPTIEDELKEEKREQVKLQKDMERMRHQRLMDANLEEDRNIRSLEKLLKLNRKKSKAVPASFAAEGLDYILEVCDPETMGSAIKAEQQLLGANDKFDEDLALMTTGGQSSRISDDDENESFDENGSLDGEDNSDEDNMSFGEREEEEENDDILEEDDEDDDTSGEENEGVEVSKESDGDISGEEDEDDEVLGEEEEDEILEGEEEDDEILGGGEEDEDERSLESDYENSDSEDEQGTSKKRKSDSAAARTDAKKRKANDEDEQWEDIYGRIRTKDGGVQSSSTKYVPPALRAKMEFPEDQKRKEKLNKLTKLVKGLMNRLAERNMHNIATQLEELYMKNSRSDMNTLLTKLVLDSVVSNVLAPERLLMEHIMLIAILHANVGTEVGANFLQTVVKQFDSLFNSNANVEDKALDNIVNVIAQLYNFKLVDAKLIYEMLEKLAQRFEEKDVECILHILRGVGFGLRKDDPLALKTLILDLQKRASVQKSNDNPRVKFMLDILLAIKNNNVTKIPNYDSTYSEHLKKIMKGFVRKGNYVSQLNITLEDLLKAEERGRWWIVGSAWTGKSEENSDRKGNKEPNDSFSQKLLELARKQRMNTDTRRTIFCTIMSAEDYLDAFEKLLKLGLKNQQERDIIHVILHCSLQEKKYNPFYSVLAQKFCEYDRKYQMTIKYSVWDKLKALKEQTKTQVANLAKLLSHLFLEKALPITTLKIMEFAELDKLTTSFIRLVLFGVLLHEDLDTCVGVFDKLTLSDKLKIFKDRLRLFIHQFILSNLEGTSLSEDSKKLLKNRAEIVVKILKVKRIKDWE